LMEGKIEEYDQGKKRKRGAGWEKRLRGKDYTGESADIVIEGNARGKIMKGQAWAHALRTAQYAKAMDLVFDTKVRYYLTHTHVQTHMLMCPRTQTRATNSSPS
jgi:U3 small nucleolar RNA-associated protein 15